MQTKTERGVGIREVCRQGGKIQETGVWMDKRRGKNTSTRKKQTGEAAEETFTDIMHQE